MDIFKKFKNETNDSIKFKSIFSTYFIYFTL